jgi:hypothetical protein
MTKTITFSLIATLLGINAAHANGFGENSPWQFETPLETSANLAVLDMIERKKGGFYDGFKTVVYSTTVTNIGSQINCSNGASALGNSASNSQTGNAITTNLDGPISATALGNSASTQTGQDGGTSSNTQTNSGTQGSSVDGSTVDLTNGSSTNGGTLNDILNNQDNSGDQIAGVNSSTACDMTGNTVTGESTGGNSGQILNSGE